MARKNSFEKTKYANIFALRMSNGTNEFYATFMLNGSYYQKKNLTRLFNATTAKQAFDKLEEIKSQIRKGKDPFSKSINDTIEAIVTKKSTKPP